MKTFLQLLGLLLCGLLLSACRAPIEPNDDGKKFIAALISEIENVDRIVVKEHSYNGDFYDVTTGDYLGDQNGEVPFVIYGEKELTSADREYFVELLNGCNPQTRYIFTCCLIEVHHTIEFYKNEQLVSEFGVCFKCRKISWDQVDNIEPQELFEVMEPVIRGIGLSPERNWQLLANGHTEDAESKEWFPDFLIELALPSINAAYSGSSDKAEDYTVYDEGDGVWIVSPKIPEDSVGGGAFGASLCEGEKGVRDFVY